MKKFLYNIQNEIQIFCLPNPRFKLGSKEKLRYQMSILVALISIATYLELIILHLMNKQYKPVFLDLIGFVSLSFGLILIKKYNHLRILSNLSLALSSIIVFIKISDSGGVYSNQFQFLYIVPLVAIICTEWVYMIFWILITIAQYFYFFGPYNKNIFLFSSFTFWDDVLTINSYVMVILITYGIIHTYKKIIEQSEDKLNTANLSLYTKNNTLSVLLKSTEQKQQEMTVLLETITCQNQKLEDKKNELFILNEKITKYTTAITQLAKIDAVKTGNLQESIEAFTELICSNINCTRTSVWFYNESRTAIFCNDLYSIGNNSHENGLLFEIEDHKAYFDKIDDGVIIIHNNVFESESAKLFLNNYFIPNHIMSNIDVPIYVYGELKGVLSCENQIESKEWKQEDINFLRSAAELIALAYVSNQQIIAEQTIKAQRNEIEVINKSLEVRIEARTAKLVEKNLQLSDFAFMHAHVMRAPICRIIGLGSILDLKLVETEDEKKDIINRIIENTKELETNLKDITNKLDNYKS